MTELERQGRQAVVDEAKTWLDTPYHHMARVKGVGVDCAQMPIAVYSAKGYVPAEYDPGYYFPQWFLHQEDESYLTEVRRFAKEFTGPALPGDFLVYKFGRCYAHGAIVVKWPLIIHAWRKRDRVCYGDASRGELASRTVKFFTIWGGK